MSKHSLEGAGLDRQQQAPREAATMQQILKHFSPAEVSSNAPVFVWMGAESRSIFWKEECDKLQPYLNSLNRIAQESLGGGPLLSACKTWHDKPINARFASFPFTPEHIEIVIAKKTGEKRYQGKNLIITPETTPAELFEALSSFVLKTIAAPERHEPLKLLTEAAVAAAPRLEGTAALAASQLHLPTMQAIIEAIQDAPHILAYGWLLRSELLEPPLKVVVNRDPVAISVKNGEITISEFPRYAPNDDSPRHMRTSFLNELKALLLKRVKQIPPSMFLPVAQKEMPRVLEARSRMIIEEPSGGTSSLALEKIVDIWRHIFEYFETLDTDSKRLFEGTKITVKEHKFAGSRRVWTNLVDTETRIRGMKGEAPRIIIDSSAFESDIRSVMEEFADRRRHRE